MSNCATIRKWVGHKLDTAIERRLHCLAAAEDVSEIAVMPDVHLAGDVCNGVVVATKRMIYPQAVGGDIGCGYLAVALDSETSVVNEETAAFILSGLYRAVPFNKHASRQQFALGLELSSEVLQKASLREGAVQLGTLGRGNHFVELQRDPAGRLWLLIHSGSRAMGQLISNFHVGRASVDSVSGLKYVDAESSAGRDLIYDFQWARKYAAANRESMLDQMRIHVLDQLDIGIDQETMIHLDHNHVESESHDGELLWVHRKGAQRLLSGQSSVIPGSMGTTTYLVQGRGNRASLNSCSHGAGRRFSRVEARRRLTQGALIREMEHVWFDQRRLSGIVDESPSAYKDIRIVMKSQKDLVKIVDRFEPVLNFKAS